MLINGSISSKKTDILINKYVELIDSGVKASEILVIVQNSNKKAQFIDKILEQTKVNSLEKLNIYSFFGLVYNTVSDNWASVENSIAIGETSILPKLVGMEISQY